MTGTIAAHLGAVPANALTELGTPPPWAPYALTEICVTPAGTVQVYVPGVEAVTTPWYADAGEAA